jgi:restriction endonuclease Mrr
MAFDTDKYLKELQDFANTAKKRITEIETELQSNIAKITDEKQKVLTTEMLKQAKQGNVDNVHNIIDKLQKTL